MDARESTPARPAVLIISHAYSEPSLQAQIDAVNELVDVRLVAPRRQLAPVFRDQRCHRSAAGITRTHRQLRLGRGQYLLLSATLGLRRRPDVVHIDQDPWSVMFWQALLLTWLWSRSSLLVIGAKKNTYRRYRGPIGRLKVTLARIAYTRAQAVVAASEMTRAMLVRELGVPPGKIVVQTHVGVDVDVFSPDRSRGPSDELVVGFCGCFAERKGVVELVRAVEGLRERGRKVRLELLGAGPLDDELAERAAAADWLTLRPVVATRDVAAFMRRLDVYALPALRLADHEEHDAHALLQAMACGLPAVASNSGIIPEVLPDGDAGVIVEAGDVGGLELGLDALITSSVDRAEMGAAARRRAVRLFALDAVAGARAELYRSVLSPARRGDRLDDPGPRSPSISGGT